MNNVACTAGWRVRIQRREEMSFQKLTVVIITKKQNESQSHYFKRERMRAPSSHYYFLLVHVKHPSRTFLLDWKKVTGRPQPSGSDSLRASTHTWNAFFKPLLLPVLVESAGSG